jgi:hypothetical protein
MKVSVLSAKRTGDHQLFLVECSEGPATIKKYFSFGGAMKEALRYSAARFCREARRDLAQLQGGDCKRFDHMQDGAEDSLISLVMDIESPSYPERYEW